MAQLIKTFTWTNEIKSALMPADFTHTPLLYSKSEAHSYLYRRHHPGLKFVFPTQAGITLPSVLRFKTPNSTLCLRSWSKQNCYPKPNLACVANTHQLLYKCHKYTMEQKHAWNWFRPRTKAYASFFKTLASLCKAVMCHDDDSASKLEAGCCLISSHLVYIPTNSGRNVFLPGAKTSKSLRFFICHADRIKALEYQENSIFMIFY